MTGRQAIVEVRDLRVQRGPATVLNIPTFAVGQGEVLSLIGPNGAGKTTLLQTLACLVKPASGELLFRGRKVGTEIPFLDFRRTLAMVFQEALLFDTTVFNNVASGLRIRGMSKAEARPLVMEQLERFGISHLAGRAARRLSGGEAQRASLARAFATGPEVILLDEPFASLDQPSRESLIEDVRAVLRKTGTTALFATHDRTEALRLSDRVGVMKGGTITQVATPSEVMNHPVDEFVASFVGVETILDGTVTDVDGGTIVVQVGAQVIEAVGRAGKGEGVILCVRPETVTLANDVPGVTTSARNLFHATITRVIPMGMYQKVILDCGFPLVAYVTNNSCEPMEIKEGRPIVAMLKATAVHVIRRNGA